MIQTIKNLKPMHIFFLYLASLLILTPLCGLIGGLTGDYLYLTTNALIVAVLAGSFIGVLISIFILWIGMRWSWYWKLITIIGSLIILLVLLSQVAFYYLFAGVSQADLWEEEQNYVLTKPIVIVAKECPSSEQGQPLTYSQLYDGPPSELASLIADEQTLTWDLSEAAVSDKGYYLGCVYGEHGPTLSVSLPSTVTNCSAIPHKNAITTIICQ